jgi:hypothetical protein
VDIRERLGAISAPPQTETTLGSHPKPKEEAIGRACPTRRQKRRTTDLMHRLTIPEVVIQEERPTIVEEMKEKFITRRPEENLPNQ